MPKNVRGKLWRKFTSLFRRRKRKYDVIAAVKRKSRSLNIFSGSDQSRDLLVFENVRSVSNVFRGKGYKVFSKKNQHTPIFTGRYKRTVSFVCQREPDDKSVTEKYVAALFKEGMLQWPYASRNSADPLCVPEVRDYPVLAVCYGFRDKELRENCKRSNSRQPVPLLELDPGMESWVQAGLNQVMIGELEEEALVDDIPVSMWMSVIEPALHTLLTYRLGRSKRLNITTRRQQTPINSLHLSTVGGDSVQQEIFAGPPNQQHWALGLVAVFTMRIGELGERQLRHRDVISDIQIPELNSASRPRNRTRTKTTKTAAVTRDSDYD